MDATLFASLTDKQLREARAKYKDVPKVLELIEQVETDRKEKQAEAEAQFAKLAELEANKALFEAQVANLVQNLTNPPEGVYNIHLRYAKTTEAVEATETTEAMPEVWGWVLEVNKATEVKPATARKATSQKRGITVEKREGDRIVPVGNFKTASEACKHLGIAIGGDSAVRVLAREGYLTSQYEGDQFTTVS